MGKVKLAICIGDEIYQERFVKCMMNHYQEQYELHVFSTLSELMGMNCRQFNGFILGECNLAEIGWDEEKQERTIILNEENMYQEVYKIVEAIEIMMGNKSLERLKEKERRIKVIGVYSLTIPHMQIPFAATLGDILGEYKKVVLLDCQENSGFEIEPESREIQLGMEDVMSIVTSGNYTKGRLLSAIGHKQSWDYIYTVRNSDCLLEATGQVIQDIIKLLVKELEYEIVIINLGNIMNGMDEVVAQCDSCFLIYPKGDTGAWREKHWIK